VQEPPKPQKPRAPRVQKPKPEPQVKPISIDIKAEIMPEITKLIENAKGDIIAALESKITDQYQGQEDNNDVMIKDIQDVNVDSLRVITQALTAKRSKFNRATCIKILQERFPNKLVTLLFTIPE
jgi:formyltetrahydrofolate synthetase